MSRRRTRTRTRRARRARRARRKRTSENGLYNIHNHPKSELKKLFTERLSNCTIRLAIRF
jgi:hypothetical protein